jgi:hypothetical protein
VGVVCPPAEIAPVARQAVGDATHLSSSHLPPDVYLPTLNRYDLAVLMVCLSLFFVAFVVYPVQQLQILVVLVTFTITLGWAGYLLQKWGFEE